MKTNYKQLGYFAPTFGLGFLFICLGIVGFLGWCFIETIIWLFSFVHVSFG